ncbi:MAG: phosphoserine transaminase [Alphaproteobacteria bacterium]|nr:phosphoserine transaminase [Alphaproteobacteria bacterium]
MQKPVEKPNCPNFSSGPCAKRPGWTPAALRTDVLGRSHRSVLGRSRLKLAIDLMKEVLQVPESYRVGIMAGSDTGAVEAALWSLLGPKGVDMFSWETFGKGWVTDVVKQLKLNDVRVFDAPYGELPDLSQADKTRDIVFAWNGTTSGVCVPNGDWIASDREGLVICDATSAAFAMDLPWDKLDVVTFSWQKALGGEAAHGVLILSPRAVERMEGYTPAWPMPKIFRMTNNGKLNEGIFVGDVINTPSMMCVEDVIDALNWAKSVGGLKGMIARSKASFKVLEDFVAKSDWAEFLAKDASYRSNTSVCLSIKADWFKAKSPEEQKEIVKQMVKLLGDEGVAFDCNAYKDAPAGLRFWCGTTVETDDVKKLCPWLDWAYEQIKE